jgi:hypothetical protein
MSILAIVGLMAWAIAVAVMTVVLIALGRSEDKRHAENMQRSRMGDAKQPLPHAACYDDCMRNFLWNASNETICATACGL